MVRVPHFKYDYRTHPGTSEIMSSRQKYRTVPCLELLDGDPAGDGGELEDVDALVEEVRSLGHADHQAGLAQPTGTQQQTIAK